MPSLNTKIGAVAVYNDRARVTRTGSLRLEPGLQQVEVAELPLKLNPESVRAAAHGTARARLLGVQVQRAYYVETPLEQIRALEDQLEQAQDELRGLDDQAELIEHNRARLNDLAGHTDIFATALASGEMSVEAQLALFERLRAGAEKLDAELQHITARKREVERRLQKLKNELDRWRGTPRREQYTAKIELDVSQAGDLTVDLSYVVSGAGWQPLYDLRLLEADGSRPVLEMSYLAQVTQRTGEAWQDVNLTLSTARPALAGTLPELDPWFIRPLPPPPPLAQPMPAPEFGAAGMPPPAMRSMAHPAQEKLEAAQEAVPAEVSLAGVNSSGAAVTYQVGGAASVPADGAPHKVTVAQVRLDPKLDYVSAPRLVEAVYRRARVTNDSPYTLLPGAANLFSGDEFIGATQLELIAPQGEIELYLGVDDRIKVERELKRREVDKRLIGSRRRLHYGYEIRLENLLPGEARLSLHDQMPVARHEEIKIRLESAEPRPGEHSELNLLAWDFTLAPKEKRVVRFDFSVEYPQGMEVLGLP